MGKGDNILLNIQYSVVQTSSHMYAYTGGAQLLLVLLNKVTYGLVWFSSILLGGVSPRTLLIDTLRVLSVSEYDTPIWISPVTSS